VKQTSIFSYVKQKTKS